MIGEVGEEGEEREARVVEAEAAIEAAASARGSSRSLSSMSSMLPLRCGGVACGSDEVEKNSSFESEFILKKGNICGQNLPGSQTIIGQSEAEGKSITNEVLEREK